MSRMQSYSRSVTALLSLPMPGLAVAGAQGGTPRVHLATGNCASLALLAQNKSYPHSRTRDVTLLQNGRRTHREGVE